LDGEQADSYSSAAISVWISVEDQVAPTEHSDEIISELRSEGWVIASELTDWSQQPSGSNEFVDQALLDGFVARIHRVETEHILLFSDSKKSISMTEQLSGFIKNVEETGMLFSLYSNEHNQYANGVSPLGGDFLPLWSSKEAIENWISDYPTYQITEIDLNTVRTLILPKLQSETMTAAMGCGDDELILVHPLLFKQQLPKIN
jgi:hypothetical protein